MNLKKLLSILLIVALLIPVAMMEEAFEPLPVAIEEPAQAPVEEAATEGEESEPVEIVTPEAVDEITEEDADAELGDIDPAVQVDVDLPDEKLLFAPMFEETGKDIAINTTNFPDDSFRKYILEEIDSNNGTEGNPSLSQAEIDSVEEIQFPENVTSIKGIEFFTNLKTIVISYCTLTDFDISSNTALEELYIDNCTLPALDVSKNTALRRLECYRNQLTSLDVSNNTALTILDCSSNQLTSLDVSKNTALTRLDCFRNQLTSLDVSKNTALKDLDCSRNKLTSLDLSKNTALFSLECCFNALKKLDITKNSKLLPSVLQGTKTVKTYEDEGSFVQYEWGFRDDEWALISCDLTTEIITEETKTPDVATTVTAPTPTPVPTPTIAAVKKSSKTTITAAPGSTYQLDLAGATGKSFKSSKKKVATVSKTGLVTVKKAGKTKITFKVGKKKRTVTLTVKDPTIPKSVALNMAGTNAVTKGESVTLTATLPEGTYSGIKWKSSNKKVATVKNGVVTFKKAGKVTITATASRGKKKAKVKFKVSK